MAAGKKISELDPILNADMATNDQFILADVSATESKSITIEEMAKRFNAVPNLVVQEKTTTYTILSGDDVVLGDTTTGAFTLTLPTAVGNDGKVITVQKTNDDLNKLTIDGNGAELVDGFSSVFLLGYGETVKLVSDGAAWVALEWTDGKDIVTTNTWAEENNIDINQLTVRFCRGVMIVKESNTTWTGSAGTAASAAWTLPGSLNINTGARFAGGTSTLNHEANKYGDITYFTTAWVAAGAFYYTTNSVRFSGGGSTLTYANLTNGDSVRFTPGAEIPVA